MINIMLANSTRHFLNSLMYHYSPIDLQNKPQYPRNFFQNLYIQNMMVSEKKKEIQKKLQFHDQKGLKLL